MTGARANRIIRRDHSIRVACNQNADLFIVDCLECFGITNNSKEGIPLSWLQSPRMLFLIAEILDSLTRIFQKRIVSINTNLLTQPTVNQK